MLQKIIQNIQYQTFSISHNVILKKKKQEEQKSKSKKKY